MKRSVAVTCLLVSLAAVWTRPVSAADATPLAVKDVGSFMILGEQATLRDQAVMEISTAPGMKPYAYDPNGEFETGQMYVSYVKLAHLRHKLPILMWHGGGLTGETWETKPDGNPGWESYFLHAGFDVYISDAVERGRSTWSKYPEIYKSQPIFRSSKNAWELFRIGPVYNGPNDKVAYADGQFPVDSFRKLAAQNTPRWLTNDAAAQKAYDAEVQRLCPCIIIAHSQGTSYAMVAAEHAPDKVKALVLVEPSSAPETSNTDMQKLAKIPYLFLWGDHLDSDLWRGFQVKPKEYAQVLKTAGGVADWIELPKQNIHGNGHMMMMEKNSDQIAGVIERWLKRQGL